jgi:hypothetical protein
MDKMGEKLIEFVTHKRLSCKCDEAAEESRYGKGSTLKTVYFRNRKSRDSPNPKT